MAAAQRHQSPLQLRSSDAALVHAFDWAKGQALSYVREGDPVGPWYEAALPGRQAFLYAGHLASSGGRSGARTFGAHVQHVPKVRREHLGVEGLVHLLGD